jgi:Mitosis protein DIM1
MFFFRNKHMMCDFGTGNNNKLNWVLEDKQELIDIIETIYKGAKKGRGLVVSPKDYSTRYRYWSFGVEVLEWRVEPLWATARWVSFSHPRMTGKGTSGMGWLSGWSS